MKSDILASMSVPSGKSKLGEFEIGIRGMTAGEEVKYSKDGLSENILKICSTCITEPKFTEKELEGLKSGVLKTVFMDIMNLSFPQDEEKNS